MCIKSVLCFHLINANRALNTNIKYHAFALMLLTKFVPNCTTRWCSPGVFFFNYDAKLASNLMQIFSVSKKCWH